MRLIRAVTCILALSLCSLVVFGQNPPKQELNDQFWEAVRKGDATAVSALLDKGADVNAKFRYGTTALFKAAERGHLEIVKILLARGADVKVKDTFYGATAMTWALDNGHLEVVKELLQKEPSSVDDVLMTGVMRERPEFIKLALSRPNVPKDTLTTALVVASRNKEKPEFVEMLKGAGAVAPPQVAPAKLQSYVGKYKSTEGMEVTIAVVDGNLIGTPAGQRPQQLIAIDETSFRALFAPDVVVRFKSESDNVTGFTLTEGAKTTQLARVAETKTP